MACVSLPSVPVIPPHPTCPQVQSPRGPSPGDSAARQTLETIRIPEGRGWRVMKGGGLEAGEGKMKLCFSWDPEDKAPPQLTPLDPPLQEMKAAHQPHIHATQECPCPGRRMWLTPHLQPSETTSQAPGKLPPPGATREASPSASFLPAPFAVAAAWAISNCPSLKFRVLTIRIIKSIHLSSFV